MEKSEPMPLHSSVSHRIEGMRQLVALLWASFLTAAAGEFVFFAVFDPADLLPFGGQVEQGSRMLIYTIIFFFFWALTAASAAVAIFLQRSPSQVNRRAASQPEQE